MEYKMTNSRFLFAIIGSLALHGGLVYYHLLNQSDSSKIMMPINAPVTAIAVTQAMLEKHIAKVDEIVDDSGGAIYSPIEVDKAVIEVAKAPSEKAKDGQSSKKPIIPTKKPENPRKTEPKKRIETEKKVKKDKSDEIEQQAKVGENQAESVASGEGGAQKNAVAGENITDIRLAYLAKVRNELERHKQYPRRARAMQIQGSVVVHFQITQQGDLVNATIVKSERSEILGKAVLDATKQYKSVGERPAGVSPLVSLVIHFNLDK